METGVEKNEPWTPASRYPDPAVQVLDPSFAPYHLSLAAVERLKKMQRTRARQTRLAKQRVRNLLRKRPPLR